MTLPYETCQIDFMIRWQLRRDTLICLILFSLSLLPQSWARWATLEDAESEILLENTDIEVNADGSFTQTIEQRIKILKENAREIMTTRRLIYNAATSSIKVLAAKTIHNGVEYPIDPKFLEDKPLASSPKGFDQHHQILVAYPEVKINSEIYLKYSLIVKEVPISGFFSTSFIYGSDSYEKSGRVRITSQKPLYFAANDPNHHLTIKENKIDSPSQKYQIEVILKKPIFMEPIDEQYVHLDPKALTWIDISSTKDWTDIAKPMVNKYESILNQPLPQAFDKILQLAKKKNKTIDQINTVTSHLAENINYLGDWRPISGLYVPRDLEKVASTKLADCKDFSAATASILRKLGLKAHISWVKRGVGIYDNPSNLPTLSEFNHAIVRVITPEKTFWVDPTNYSSFSQGIFPDIADRKTLVMDPQKISMEKIPALQPEDGNVILVKNFQSKNEDQFEIEGQLQIKGFASIPYTGLSLKASKQSIDYGLIKAIGDENRIIQWSVEPSDLSSRIVSDLSFQFHFIEKDEDLKTSAGPAIRLSAGSYIPVLLTKTTDRVSDLFIGTPLSVRKEFHMNKISRLGTHSLDCDIKSPWINASRSVSDQEEGLLVVDEVIIKKSNIPNQELHSSEYSQLQKSLQKCFYGTAIVYSKEPKKSILR